MGKGILREKELFVEEYDFCDKCGEKFTGLRCEKHPSRKIVVKNEDLLKSIPGSKLFVPKDLHFASMDEKYRDLSNYIASELKDVTPKSSKLSFNWQTLEVALTDSEHSSLSFENQFVLSQKTQLSDFFAIGFTKEVKQMEKLGIVNELPEYLIERLSPETTTFLLAQKHLLYYMNNPERITTLKESIIEQFQLAKAS